MLQSSAYRTNRCPRRSSSRSSSSSTRLLSSGESGPPCRVPSTLGLTNRSHSLGPVATAGSREKAELEDSKNLNRRQFAAPRDLSPRGHPSCLSPELSLLCLRPPRGRND